MASVLIVAGKPSSLVNFRGALIQEFIKQGISVHVCAPGFGEDVRTASLLSEWGVVVHDVVMNRTGINPANDFHYCVQLYKLLRQVKPQYILSYTAKPVIFGGMAAFLAGVPHRFALVTGLGYAFSDEGGGKRAFTRWVMEKLYRASLKRMSVVFFQNPDDQALFRQRSIIADDAGVVVNGSGVDLSEFPQSPAPSNPLVFLFVGRLLGDKGIREFISAAEMVKAKHPEAEFHIAGGIDINPDAITQQEVDKWVAAGVIRYLGRLDDVRPALAASSVFVLPSYREGTPRSVLEALATGRSVITTDAPGCRETVVDGYNGYLVPVRAVAELQQAMERFIEQPALLTEMAANSHDLARNKYDVHKVNEFMLRHMGILK